VEREGVKIAREVEAVVKEGEKVVKVERSARFARFLRPLFRLPRLFKAAAHTTRFYEKPSGEHHHNKYMLKVKRK
jgi:hypothetical protein